MFIVNPWLVLAPVLGLLVLWRGRLPVSRKLVRGSVVFLALAFSAWLWVPAHFAAVGCRGDMAVGITCPQEALMTKFALLHQVLMLMGQIYFYLVLPVVFVVIFWMERRAV